MPTDTGFGDFAEKFRKISENYEKSKILENSSETEIGQIGLLESQIGLLAGIGFPVRVRFYFRSEDPDLILKNISNNNSKTHRGRKLSNMIEKILGLASRYVSRVRGATIYPPNKNFVLEICIRREMNMKEITVNDDK